ncbi:MAG: hypothetical protein H7144_06990 [Burkholderiales bacterium]|nr:hypothetical protein [Phycisphaerae bacterium]
MLDGLTTVIAAFFLYCLARQDMIKNKTYYYFTFACLLGIVLFSTLYYFLNDVYGRGFCAIVLGVLHVAALLLTMGYVGGVTLRGMAGEMKDAVDDFRAGGDAKKSVIVPLTGQQPAPRTDRVDRPDRTDSSGEAERPRIVIDLPKRDDDKPQIPLE